MVPGTFRRIKAICERRIEYEVLVIRTGLEYGLLSLEDASQYTQRFKDVEEIIKFFTDYEFRIIKSYHIELREV